MRRRDLLIGSLAGSVLRAWPVGAQPASPVPNQEWAQPDWFATPEWIERNQHDPGVVLLELIAPDEFAGGHIPGSVQIDWPDLALTDSADATVDEWRADIEAKLTERGITPASTVVVYDGGSFYAARLWWILDQLGHKGKRVLDGGFGAWKESGGEIEIGSAWAGVTPGAPYRGKPNESTLARLAEVEAVVKGGDGILVDARSPDEFDDGHIPGAVSIPFTDNAAPDSGGRWKSPADLRERYEGRGVTPGQLVIPYCSTGVRSAVTYFTLRALGYERVRLYSASFAEWSSDPSREVSRES
jgi:thiosulfate/3-mercaptopyruvate sulfurtransferase